MLVGLILCMSAGISGCNAAPVQPLDPWIPVTRIEAPRKLDRKPGWYKNRESGTVSYFDGCNWCHPTGDFAMSCTLLACMPAEVTFVEGEPK